MHLLLSDSLSKQYFSTYTTSRVDVIAGDANAAAHKYYKKQEYHDLYNSSVAVMLIEMQREVNTGYPFGTRLNIDYYHKNQFYQLSSASDLDCCFMPFLP